jgi:iron complex outermembrane receptor protein
MRSTCRVASVALLLTVSPLALGTAHAQTSNTTTQSNESGDQVASETTAAQPAPEDPAAQARESGQVENIVVTAQRRSEAAQDVPISLQAFSQESLENAVVERTEDLTNIVGGFIIQPSAARPALFLRGVGTNSSNTTPAVLTFIDGVYQPFGQSVDLANISSIEVLKGPQGTLFGRNATGGVIQITTRPPSQDFGGRFEIGYGNYDTVSGLAYVTGGLANGVAADLSVRYIHQDDGFGTNVFNGADVFFTRRLSLRSRIRFDLSDLTNITLSGDYSRLRGTVGANVSPAVGYGFLFVNGAIRRRGEFYPGDFDVNANLQPGWESREWGTSLTFETGFSGLTLRSISSYRQSDEQIRIDFDGGPANAINLGIDRDPRKAFTQEVQLLSGSGGSFNWVVGGFYYWANWASDPFQLCTGGANLFTAGCGPVAISHDRTNSVAAYAQGTYEFLPDTRLTLGARYTIEKREINGTVFIGGNEVLSRRGTLSQDVNEPTWRVAIDHKFTPDTMVYASVSRGFNSGFFSQTSTTGFANETQNPRVLPEFLTVYEVGTKLDLLDRHLRFNLSGYLYDYSNLQQQIYDQGVVKTINAGSARIKGIDFEIVARPTRNLTLSWTGTYLDAYYTSYVQAPLYVLQTDGRVLAVGNVDAAGNNIVNAPDWSWTASVVHTLPTSIGEFTTSANLNYRGETFIDPANRFPLPTRYVFNAAERWRSPDERFSISVWVENLFNERYDYAVNILTPAGLVGNTAPPRTYGITAGVEF